MGNYFSSIKVEDVANVTNATNDAEHDDVLVLSAKSVDPLEIKNDEKNEKNEKNVDDENVVITVEEKKDLDLSSSSSSSSSGYETRTTVNDVVYTKKNIKKKNKNKKNKGKGIKK
jgi:hypothetical protein